MREGGGAGDRNGDGASRDEPPPAAAAAAVVVLVSFMRDLSFWREGARKLVSLAGQQRLSLGEM